MVGGRDEQGDVVERVAARLGGRAVLVTGGASFIGSHLTELLVRSGAQVRVADDLSSGRLEHLAEVHDDVDVRIGDLRDPTVAAAATAGVEVVFHLAARHGGRGYIDSHPVDCVGNAALDHTVFRAAADAGVGQVVFASSACVYPLDTAGTDTGTPLHENAAGFDAAGLAFADGEYGWAKLYGELQLAAFAKEGRFEGVACRLFNAYGERENESHALIALVLRALDRRDPFTVWGDGTQRRSFTYIADIVAGLALAGGLGRSAVMNVGATDDISISDLCSTIFDLVGWWPSQMHLDTTRPVGSHSRRPDMSTARDLLDWQPSVPLLDGLSRTIDHCRDQRPLGAVPAEPRLSAPR